MRPKSKRLATFFASLGFVVLVVGVTYFAMLVLAARFADDQHRAANYYELAKFLDGRLEWYKNAHVYGAFSLLLALVSLLFGTHKLARITIPVAGLSWAVLHFYDEQIWNWITVWALKG